MRLNQSPLIRYGLPIAALGVAALMLVPGDDATPRASTESGVAPRMAPSYLAASRDLLNQLDALLASSATTENVAAREASLPEPAAQTVASASDRALHAARKAAERATAEPENVDPIEVVAPVGALRVGDNGVNMRVGPSTKTGVIRTLQPGEALAMGETDRGWVSVRTEDGASGWVYSSYLTGPALAEAGLKQPVPETVQVRQTAEESESRPSMSTGAEHYARAGSDTYLRAGPSQGTERLFVLPAGERVAIAEVRGGWARVVLRSGESGWVRIR